MRRTIALLLAVLLLGSGVMAENKNDWANVQNLQSNSFISVSLENGTVLRGHLESVTDTKIDVYTTDRFVSRVDRSRTIDRADVKKIVLRREAHPPDPNKILVAGAAVGAVGGLIFGIVRDARRGESYNWFLDGFAGAGLGFAGSVALTIPIETISIARSAHGKVIYEKKAPSGAKSHNAQASPLTSIIVSPS